MSCHNERCENNWVESIAHRPREAMAAERRAHGSGVKVCKRAEALGFN